MDLKVKIALNGLKRRLDRGAISLADAITEYKKITGQDPDDEFVNSENSDIDPENPETEEKKTEQDSVASAYGGYSPPGVVTEPVTDHQTEETVIEKVKAAKETSPKRVDTQRTVKKTEDPK